MSITFLSSMPTAGTLFDFRSDDFPTWVSSWCRSHLTLESRGTHFGLVHQGRALVSCTSGTFELNPGAYFSIPGPARIEGEGAGFVVTRIDYLGFFQIGGPVEETGRLQYIDGCSDSLLIAPVMRGDPCLNLLHIPERIDQTPHTHPSLRVGMIVDGLGICRTPAADVELMPGLIFVIRTGGLHSFHTAEESLRIVAWHPDSDFGPTHEQHPMLNRTFINGRPINASAEQETGR